MTTSSISPRAASLRRLAWPALAILLYVILFAISRMLYLDQDAPAFWFTIYSSVDELYSTISAFNLLNHGTWTHKYFDFLPPDELPFSTLLNLMTFFSLRLFGNTFEGIRTAAVWCGGLIALSTLLCVWTVARSRGRWGIVVTAACALYLLVDFFFLTSNRFNEHTVYVMLSIAVAMLLTAYYPSTGRLSPAVALACGIFAGSTITFIYIYSMPVAIALGATIFLTHLRDGIGRLVTHVAAFVVGAAVSVGLFAIFLHYAFDMSLQYYFAMMKGIGTIGTTRRMDIDPELILTLIKSNTATALYQSISQNLFRYNPALLFVFLVSLPFFIMRVIRHRKPLDIFVATFLCARLALSVYIPNDWFERKLVQIFPCVVYIVAVAALEGRSLARRYIERGVIRIASFFALIAIAGSITHWMVIRELQVTHRPPDLIANNWFWLAAAASILLCWSSDKLYQAGLLAIATALVVPNLHLDYRFLYQSPSFRYRDSLKEAAVNLNGKLLAGGLSYGVRLYNTSVPVMNFYNYYWYGRERFEELGLKLYSSGVGNGTAIYLPPVDHPLFVELHRYISENKLILVNIIEHVAGDGSKDKIGVFMQLGGEKK
jgi:hypothetical protein